MNDQQPTTTIEKSKHHGWNAETLICLGPCKDTFERDGVRYLSIATRKNTASPGGLYSAASCQIHRDGIVSFMIGGDFRVLVNRVPGVRCTEASIRAAHEIALAKQDDILASARAFYQAKEAADQRRAA